MLGLSLGSWIGGKWISYLKNKTNLSAIIFYGLTEIIIGLGAFAVPQLFTIDARLLLPLGEINAFQYLLLSALVLGLSIFPFCFAMGVTYPFMMEFIQELKWEERTSFSYLYLANGVGAMFGTIMTALFLVEKLGFSKTLMFGAFGNFSIALICLSKGFYKIPPSNIEKPLFPKIIVAMETWLLNNKSRTYLSAFCDWVNLSSDGGDLDSRLHTCSQNNHLYLCDDFSYLSLLYAPRFSMVPKGFN